MKVIITGSAGFIGFHLAKLLLKDGFQVHGYDGMTDYYDVTLKKKRHSILLQNPHFTATEGMLEDHVKFSALADKFNPEVIVHLAAQAGVRYSLENPRAYLDSNIIGTFNVMETAKKMKIKHLLMASTSSVYGANSKMPFTEVEKADTQLTIYAATKKANEVMAHSYAHLWKIPITILRFFTVYGPWGRPDMFLYKFVTAILQDKPIDIYNQGDMYRDFTYVDDVARSIRLLIDVAPKSSTENYIHQVDSLSLVAPYRIINIANSNRVKLLDFIDAIENFIGKKAIRNYKPMQMGDVPSTWADISLLERLIDYRPQTNYHDGIKHFIDWYRDYYNVQFKI